MCWNRSTVNLEILKYVCSTAGYVRAGLEFEAIWTDMCFSSAAPTAYNIHYSSISTEMSLMAAQGSSSLVKGLGPAHTVLSIE